MKIYSFTFARGGSKGVQNKNLKKFKNKSLISWAINDCKKSKFINKSFISTDSSKIANEAKKAGAIVPFIRPKNLSTDLSPEYLSWKHALKFLKKNNDLPDIFLSVPCTSPLRTSKDLDKMISIFIKKKPNLLVAVSESDRSPYFNMFKMKKNNMIEIFAKPKKKIFRRQDCPKTYNLTTFAFISNPNYILKSNNFYSRNVIGFKVEKKRSIDIDTIEDIKYAEFLNKIYGIKK